MSIMCPMEKCKAQKGPYTCEKVMGVVVLLAAAFGLYKHFA